MERYLNDCRGVDAAFDGIQVGVAEVLQFREKKAMLQIQLFNNDSDVVIVSLGMNIPGPVKCSSLIYCAFDEGIQKLERLIREQGGEVLHKRILNEDAGYAAVYSIRGIDSYKIKKETILLEDTHPLGRLWDIDIVRQDGLAVGRNMIVRRRRKCFLCSCSAGECGRSRKHEVGELQKRVVEIILNWQAGNRE